MASGGAVSLRTGATVMRVNVDDAHGASWGASYAAVAVGDGGEWRQADDCWVRYRVTSPPASTLAARRAFGVRWVTSAATGCTGDIARRAEPSAAWDPELLDQDDVTSPIRHGPCAFRSRLAM